MQLLKCLGVLWVIGCGWSCAAEVQDANVPTCQLIPVAEGWAQNSVNAVIFRRNSIVTHENTQVVSFYDPNGRVVLARRQLDSNEPNEWEIERTPYYGNVNDAHCSISIMIDGDGFLHLSWGHHGDPLRYCRSVEPNSLELTGELSMTGYKEWNVTYPEFHRLSDGNLLFLYRDGSSGQGDVMMNYYDCATQTWSTRQDSFISGEGDRNAYWQMTTDPNGGIHLSWVWRESSDVASNHDLCYAKSLDQGLTWMDSEGDLYDLPIVQRTAEVAWKVDQGRELMNQTSMCADALGHPYIVNYWENLGSRGADPNTIGVPQYYLVYHDGDKWHKSQITQRTTDFSLSGSGTKKVPISRPQIAADSNGVTTRAVMIFRDIERDSRVSLAICADLTVDSPEWTFADLTTDTVDQWEPSYDTELWRTQKKLHIFVQRVAQGDGETIEELLPQMVYVGQWEEWAESENTEDSIQNTE